MKPGHRRRPNRAGYVAVLFVMMFFGLMGLAALVIDMGFARLAQRQMQTAVDSAALEGLRWRDDSAGGPDAADANRRQQASNMAAYTFDADLDLTTSDTQYGAGPVVTFVGDSEVGALQSMQPGAPYKPSLQMNYPDNKPEGDMAAGTYNAGQPSAERDDYTRDDFSYAPPGSAPSISNAFLVRMRRTANTNSNTSNNTSSLDQKGGISSSGPTLPVLFGRGSMMARNGNGLSVMSGITVRATAIAAAGDGVQSDGTLYSAGRAKAAGPPLPDYGIAGFTPFALSQTAWASMGTSPTTASSPLWFAAPPGALQIGSQLVSAANPPNAGSGSGYVPIYQTYIDKYSDAYDIIIGFGYVQWSWDGTTLTVTPASAHVASSNASAVLAIPLAIPVDADGNPVVAASTLFNDHANLANPLYAPVLVNHYIGSTP